MRIDFQLTGLTPLLMHNDDVEASDRLERWRKDSNNKGISKAGDDRSPAWTWMTYLYHDGTHLAIPSQNLMVSLRQAGGQMILKKQKTFKEISQSGMGIFTEYLEFGCPCKVPIKAIIDTNNDDFLSQSDETRKYGFRLFVKRARIGTAKHVRVRPRFDTWTASGTVVTVAQELTFETVSKLFELAGRIGLCDWRPGCKTPGPFGMFSATLKKVD